MCRYEINQTIVHYAWVPAHAEFLRDYVHAMSGRSLGLSVAQLSIKDASKIDY